MTDQGPLIEAIRSLGDDKDDEFLTRREAKVILETGRSASRSSRKAHRQVHRSEKRAVTVALEVTNRDRITHEGAHDREHELHADKHASEGLAIKTALDAVARERVIHADAHEREHLAHTRIHELNQIAVTKAEQSVEERLKAMNEFRGQLRDQQATLASREVVDSLAKEIDRRFIELNTAMLTHFDSAERLTQDRFETNRARIDALEKSDVKGEGKSAGQGLVIAAIIGAVSFASLLLGFIILIANVLTGKPV